MIVKAEHGKIAMDWAFLKLGEPNGWDQDLWELYAVAETARQNGERDGYAEEALWKRWIRATTPRIGPGVQVNDDLIEVVRMRYGSPTAILFLNKEAWAVVNEYYSHDGNPFPDLYIGEAIHVGAEPVNYDLVRYAYYYAA